jgi:hypothetical protein
MSPRERPPGATTSSKNSTWRASWRSQNVFCRAPPISVQASLEQRPRFQQRFYPDGIAFDGNWNRRNRTGLLLLAAD